MKLPLGLRSVVVAAATLGLLACATPTENAESTLLRAEQAMGGATLKTLRYAGSGTGAVFGQAWQPGQAWPQVKYSSFSRVLDYDNAALREDYARSRAEPTGGGALPLIGQGEQRVTGLLRGDHAWNMAGPAPVPAAIAVDGRIHDLWTTPHGVVKAARKNKATMRTEGGMSVVTFTEPGRFSATAWINGNHQVERVESIQPHPVMGDTRTATVYSGYRDFGGVQFPTRIRQEQGGFPVLDLEVSEVQANAPAGIEVPALVPAATERVTVEKVADGVWYLAGGSHHSVAIEMSDHLVVVESPLYDGRASAMLAQARQLVPGKTIRYVINSHHHFDHAGGLRSAAAEGAMLVTSEQARPYFERVLANPNRIRPDALQQSGRKAMVTGISGRRVFSDGTRSFEVHFIEDSVHAQGFMMVYLPREKLLVEADAYTPGAPNTPPPAQPNANNVNLVQNIERLKLQVERILPLHGRIVPVSELYTAIGRRP
ncbi:MAG TPA: MBL fold metallo-hydrolase [Burkholderiaceae bacterium]|nr:MBL fold metallo-hydrolase [Burkholderiaceae bacterium]